MNHPNVQRLKQLPFVEVCLLDLAVPSHVAEAVKGVDKVVVIPPYVEHMKDWCYRLLDTASNVGVSHLVLVSTIRGPDVNKSNYARQFVALETRLASLNLSYTVLRCPLFMDTLLNFAGDIKQGKFIFPEGASAPLAIEDLAYAIVCAITKRKDTAAFDITGPELLNHKDIAKMLSSTLGKQIEYVPAGLEPRLFRKDLINRGIAQEKADAMMELFTWYAQGETIVSSDYEKLVGKKAMTLVDFTKKYKELFV